MFRIDWQVPGDVNLDEEERSGQLDARIRAIIGPEAAYAIVWQVALHLPRPSGERMQAGRVVAGGRLCPPRRAVRGQGLNSGVHDAENAAWKLAFVLRGWAPAALLQTYDTERRAAARENLAITETHDAVPRAPDRGGTRPPPRRARARPPRSRRAGQVDSGRMYEPFWYVDSP